MRRDRGFTLMELMIVIAIIMLLAGAIVIKLGPTTESAKIAKATKECEEIASAVKAFYLDTGHWPGNILTQTGKDSGLLKDPVELNKNVLDNKGNPVNPKNLSNYKWNGPYLEAEVWPKDPWGEWWYAVYKKDKALVACCRGPNKKWNSEDACGQGKASVDDIVILVNIFED